MRLQIGKSWFRGARLPVLPLFCVSLLAGMLIMNIAKSALLENTGLFDEKILYTMKYMTVDGNALFSYVLRERLVRLLWLALLATTYLGLVLCVGTVIWYGMSAGMFFSALTLRYGVKGIFLGVVALFPHYLLYVPAVLALIAWCETLYRRIYGKSAAEEGRGYWVKKLAALLGILAAVTGGCLLEAYVNPAVLLGYLKIF